MKIQIPMPKSGPDHLDLFDSILATVAKAQSDHPSAKFALMLGPAFVARLAQELGRHHYQIVIAGLPAEFGGVPVYRAPDDICDLRPEHEAANGNGTPIKSRGFARSA